MPKKVEVIAGERGLHVVVGDGVVDCVGTVAGPRPLDLP